MIDAPLRPSTGGNLPTPSKEPTIQVSGGEENQPINIGDSNRHLPNKRSSSDTPSVDKTMPLIDSRPDKRVRSLDQQEVGSDCDTEVSTSTVSARREWLKEFGKQHENKFPKKSTTQPTNTVHSVSKFNVPTSAMRTPPKAPRESTRPITTESAASTLVNRMMISEPSKRGFAQPASKPKLRHEEVQATNDGYASVARLSEWLANDPTSTKKKKHVRRGKNVITKSRTFEKDAENVILIETKMPRGAVQDRKKWIQGALRDERAFQKDRVQRYTMSEAGAGDLSSRINVADKKDWLKKAFKTAVEDAPKENDEESRSEIITNDAASSLSVSDKKDWLTRAFQKGIEGPPSKKVVYNKAMTDVLHNRGGGDDAAARAKRRFLERSQRTPTKSTPKPSQHSALSSRVLSASRPESKHDTSVRAFNNEERTGPPSAGPVVEPVQSDDGSVVEPTDERPSFEEDQTPVDFRIARQALIQRGKQNGHAMQVVNKVYMKKTKYENIEREHRRRSGPQGLLKPSWEEADPGSGRASTAYDKKYVSDIAPKKSFEELP